MGSDKIYCSSRETFGMSINREFLAEINTSNCWINSTLVADQLSIGTRVAIGIPYLVWAMFGTVSNLMVIILIARKPSLRTIFKLLLLNLAVADTIVTGVVIPILGSWQAFHYPEWSYTRWTCKILNSSSHMGGIASGATIVAVSVYRFLVIKYPKRFHFKRKHLVFTILLIWALAIGGSVGSFQKADIVSMIINGKLQRLCLMLHNKHSEEKKQLAFRLCLYLVNSSFLIILYTFQIRLLRQMTIPGLHSVSDKERASDMNKRQAVHMMLTAAAAMLICYLPYMTLVTLNLVAPKGFYSIVPGIEILSNIIVAFNCVVDPVIYCAFSSQIRNEFKTSFFYFWKKNNNVYTQGNTQWFVKTRPRLRTFCESV